MEAQGEFRKGGIFHALLYYKKMAFLIKYQRQIMIKALVNFVFMMALLCQETKAFDQAIQYRTAEVLEYGHVFSETSDLSVIVLACGGKRKLQLTLKSFFYFNTYPISKMYIAHCSMDAIPMSLMLPFGFQTHRGFFQILPATDSSSGLIDALENVYSKITTKYVYQTDGQWVMTKGFGFIEESISLLKYANKNAMKVSQIVSNYPYWRANARLSQMKWADSGQAYHFVIPFAAQNYAFFTLSPSLFQFQVIYSRLLNKSLKKICSLAKCDTEGLRQKNEQDKCCLWAIGQQLKRQGYLQVYINDGTGEPNHHYIQQ